MIVICAVIPLWVDAVIVTVPGDTAVTIPVSETKATPGLLLLHVTFLFVAFAGNTVTVISLDWPASICEGTKDNVIRLGSISFTVTLTAAVSPFDVSAVTTAFPGATALIHPS